MYVRWKAKPRTKQEWGYHGKAYWHPEAKVHSTLLCAYLVESKRIDGKPRQKAMYLASIRDSDLSSAYARLNFWKHVQAKIQSLSLSADQLSIIKSKLLQRVPDVTREQIIAEDEEYGRLMTRLKARL